MPWCAPYIRSWRFCWSLHGDHGRLSLYRQRSFCSPFESAQPWADWLVSRIGPRSRVETPQIIPPVRWHPRRGWDSPRKPITLDTRRQVALLHAHTLVSRIKSDANHATPPPLDSSLPRISLTLLLYFSHRPGDAIRPSRSQENAYQAILTRSR